MIVVKIYGGIGNQLFQYAASLAIIKKFEIIYYDDYWFRKKNDGSTKRDICFEKIGINFSRIGFSWLVKLLCRALSGRVLFGIYFAYITDSNKKETLKSSNFRLIYLDGYFQDERQVSAARKYMADLLAVEAKKYLITNGVIEQMNSSVRSIAMHVRRGDYINSINVNIYCELKAKYYQDALKTLESRNAKVFIFSDDPQWVIKNIKFDCDYIMVSGRGLSDVDELLLMSRCNDYIIANSTFSWWAAYVGTANLKGRVVYPENWFIDNIEKSKLLYIPNGIPGNNG